MLQQKLRRNKAQIELLMLQFGGRRIRVFGSVARGDDRPDSDIDFLVDFPHGYDMFTQRLPLTEKLSELLDCRITLIPEHELSPHIRKYVMQEAVDL